MLSLHLISLRDIQRRYAKDDDAHVMNFRGRSIETHISKNTTYYRCHNRCMFDGNNRFNDLHGSRVRGFCHFFLLDEQLMKLVENSNIRDNNNIRRQKSPFMQKGIQKNASTKRSLPQTAYLLV